MTGNDCLVLVNVQISAHCLTPAFFQLPRIVHPPIPNCSPNIATFLTIGPIPKECQFIVQSGLLFIHGV